MSSLALMRFLESAPRRYDWGMKLITLGGVTHIHDAIARHVMAFPGSQVLEIGCGTGAITRRVIDAGLHVVAFDQNPDMLDIAREGLTDDQKGLVDLREMTASEIDSFPEGSFDVVVASLSLSEMARHERVFVLCQAFRVLRSGGTIVIGDETFPGKRWKLLIVSILRVLQVSLAWLLIGSWSTPIANLTEEVAEAGFAVASEERWRLDSLAVIVARKPS